MKYKINFIPRLLNKIHLLKKFNLVAKIKVESAEFNIPILNGIGFSNIFDQEKWMTHLLKAIIRNNDGVFIDVGVNLGQTLLKVKAVEPRLRYIGFEPNPVCTYYCYELIKQNNLLNVEIIPVAISNTCGIINLNLYNDDKYDSAASIINNFRPNEKIIQSRAIATFNPNIIDLIKDLEISCIKIDVEGAELEVIEGFKDIITSNRPIIICEILPVYSEQNAFRIDRQSKILNLLKDLSYLIIRIEENSFKKLEAIEVHSDISLTNYLIVPEEQYSDKKIYLSNYFKEIF